MRCELMPLQPSIAFTCRAALAEMPEGFNVWTHFPLSALTEIFVDWTLHFNFDAQEWIGTSIEPWWCTLVAPLMQGLGVEFWSKMCNTKGELFIGRYLRYFDLIFSFNPLKAGLKGLPFRASWRTWRTCSCGDLDDGFMKIHDLRRFIQLHRLQHVFWLCSMNGLLCCSWLQQNLSQNAP